ncbi:MAG TPA: O-antigen ligase family protein [Candidatus Binatia bacterium]
MQKLLDWWERGIIIALFLSVALLGIGRLAFPVSGASVSAWSISRTTFFFWLILKLVNAARPGWTRPESRHWRSLVPLGAFFLAVTVSLLPEFRFRGDYRYFFFGCAHAVMLVDLFSSSPLRRWLPILLGVLPLVLVARGLADNPALFHFDLEYRFGFPLDHPNSAGYLFAMSLPLCVFAAGVGQNQWRNLARASCAGQAFALILTFSRGAWLGALAAFTYLAVVQKKWQYLMLLALIAIACLLAFPSIFARLASISRPLDDESIRDRVQLITSSLQLGLEHPVLGVGYGRGRLKQSLRSRLRGTVIEDSPIWHTHNVFVELFAETGFIGLAAFLWLVGMTLFRVARAARQRRGIERLLGSAIGAAWVAAVVAGLGDVPFYHHEVRIYFFTVFALAHLYAADAGMAHFQSSHGAPLQTPLTGSQETMRA